jgi:hypothetical protein
VAQAALDTPKPADFHLDTNGADAPPPPKLRAMELKRHYRPTGTFELVGYNRPEIKRKAPDGREIVIQDAAFIPDEMAPSPMPGVEVKGKIWATTVIKVPADEARTMRANGIADVALED